MVCCIERPRLSEQSNIRAKSHVERRFETGGICIFGMAVYWQHSREALEVQGFLMTAAH